MVNIET